MAIDWGKVGRAIADSAPILGSVLGGPAGGAVGSIVASTLGTSASPEAVMEKLKADPDAMLKLQELERTRAKDLQDFQLETLRAELADTQSARAAHATHWMPSAITLALTVMVCAMGGSLLFYAVPPENKDMTVYLFGQITGTFTTAVAYWIGTSRSSLNKDRMLLDKAGA